MLTIDWRHRSPEIPGDYFPAEILDDPWVIYHGTSGIREVDIEDFGLRPAKSLVGAETLSRIVDLFKLLDWGGWHKGGYSVLAACSRFDVSRGRPVFLAESAYRAALYSEADFAGGESVRAMHHALGDLEGLLNGEHHDYATGGDIAPNLNDAQRHDIRTMLEELRDLRASLEAVRDAHSHGVIYAVRIEPADLLHLTYSNFMGLMLTDGVAADRLVAKALLPACVERQNRTDDRLLRFVTEGRLLIYLELAASLRAVMSNAPENELVDAITTAVTALGDAGATPDQIRGVAKRLRSLVDSATTLRSDG